MGFDKPLSRDELRQRLSVIHDQLESFRIGIAAEPVEQQLDAACDAIADAVDTLRGFLPAIAANNRERNVTMLTNVELLNLHQKYAHDDYADVKRLISAYVAQRNMLREIAGLIGNVDHSTGNGVNAAKMRGDLLNDIRAMALAVLEPAASQAKPEPKPLVAGQ